MKIKKIDILGFKSFLDKASIAFPSGISAIVGPNGCGKSNVIDALRWVMGEQSVKQLRGKAMEDIIFAGASGKAPLSMAEVTLTLANDNGHAPEAYKDYPEISITRRLFRSGESAYLINRQPCRLKDIYSLFMGSGVGTRTFSIIQQGNIGAIIDAGPDERRLFIEEAAGVTRYKFRKNEALRKIKATHQNLLRINDIIAEINRQMAGLRRQAKKAERYNDYQKRIKSMDTLLLLHYYDNYNRQLNDAQSLMRELKDTDIGHVAQLKKVDAAIEEIKLKRHQKDQEIGAQKTKRFDTQRTIDRAEAERVHLSTDIQRLNAEADDLERASQELNDKTENIGTEVAQVAQQNTTLEKNIEQIKTQIDAERQQGQGVQTQLNALNESIEAKKNELMRLVAEEARYKNIYQNTSSNKESVKRRLVRIDEEVALAGKKVGDVEKERHQTQLELKEIQKRIADHNAQIEAFKSELTTHSDALGAQVKTTQRLELNCHNAQAQLAALKKMAANFEWYRDGVKAIMQARHKEDNAEASQSSAKPLKGIIGLLADIIEPAPGYETAVEAVLGEALQYILVENQDAGASAIDYLQASRSGRSGFIPVAAVKPLGGAEKGPVAPAHGLLQHLSLAQKYQPIAQALLGHVAVVPTMADALALFNRNGCVQTIVTQSGDVVSHQGIIIGGSQEQLTGILSKKKELKTLKAHCQQLDQQLIHAKDQQTEMEEVVRQLETKLQKTIALKNEDQQEAVDIEKALYRLGEDLKNAQRHLEIVELEQEQLLGEESDLEEELSRYNQALAKITEGVKQAQAGTAEASQQIGRLSARLETHNQKVVDLKLQLTAFHTQLDNGTQTLSRLKEFESDSYRRLEQLQKDIAIKKQKSVEAQSQLAAKEQSVQQMYEVLKRLEIDLSSNEDEYNVIDTHLKAHDEHVTALQSERGKTLEKIRLLELDLSEKRIMRDNIAGKAQERYHLSISNMRLQQADASDSLKMSVAEMEKELEKFRAKMAHIGDVNLGAIKEYEELKERFDFLTEQRQDLENAIEDLDKVIRKINRITQTKFVETFEQVNAKLTEVFPKLFEGGAAKLELTEPGKPLETGVEFMVHPPGKKLTRMSLLSGGEKALSAIAFIFAIFLIRPASFCLLDEIDAPLDEANVVRFNNLMQVIGKKSQIIMITHNKKTMEFAESLYGITMEQKGISKVVSVNLMENAA